jgi:hypothetical protein
MKFALIISLVTLSLSAAPRRLGSQCGLVDSTEGEDFVVTASRSLDNASYAAINKLPTLTKQQLIIAAKDVAKGDIEAPEINNTFTAVRYLRSFRGLTIVHANAGGTMVTEMRSYPGDNAYGPIFLQGTKRIVAFENDGDIVCK